jgi:hypothetical protein
MMRRNQRSKGKTGCGDTPLDAGLGAPLGAAVAGGGVAVLRDARLYRRKPDRPVSSLETEREHGYIGDSALVEESPVAARLCQSAYPVPWGCRDLPEGHRESSKAKPCRDSTVVP